MFQQFFTTTVVGSFIKALLQSTPLPKYKTVKDGDKVRADFVYVYGIYLIKCTETGTIGGDATYDIIKNAFDAPTDSSGTFFFGEQYAGRTDHIHSLNSYYDEDTHEALGNYLRCYRDLKGIDLMPFYNCFSYRVATDFYMEKNANGEMEIKESYEDKYKVLLIPIRFNQKYSVFVDSISPVVIRPVIYNNGLVRNAKNANYLYNNVVFEDNSSPYKRYSQSSYNSPIVVGVKTKEDSTNDEQNQAYAQERYLYLALQLSKDNKSSICVLEGEYKHGDNATWTVGNKSNWDSLEFNNEYEALPFGTLEDHGAYRVGDADAIEYEYPDNVSDGFYALVSFTPRDGFGGIVDFYDDIEFRGDDVINNQFTYVLGKSYDALFTYNGKKIVTIQAVPDNNASIVSDRQLSTLSLTQMNDGNIYAFSDRLVEYLLKNVIDSDDTIDDNVVRVQSKSKQLLGYTGSLNGVYGDDLKKLIFNKYMREVNPKALDITGYTDKDIEGWLDSYGR